MNASPLHFTRIALLAFAAVLLGMVVLWTDGERRDGATAGSASLAGTVISSLPARASQAEAITSPPSTTVTASADITSATPAPDLVAAAAVAPVVERLGGVPCAAPHRTVAISRDTVVRAVPGGRAVGTLPAESAYLGSPMMAWVQTVSVDGAWGKITIPWGRSVGATGWVSLAGSPLGSIRTMIVTDLSDRTMRVYRGCDELFAVPSAIGAGGSPSPTGRFWVTDRIAVPRSQPYFGSFAFGLSTIQPHPPAGWTGGNQMAIHGTNAPSSIGTAASAGCLRVSERTLDRLKPLLAPGTPVVIKA